MRAVVQHEPGGPEVLTLSVVADPVPGAADVIVDVAATALPGIENVIGQITLIVGDRQGQAAGEFTVLRDQRVGLIEQHALERGEALQGRTLAGDTIVEGSGIRLGQELAELLAGGAVLVRPEVDSRV